MIRSCGWCSRSQACDSRRVAVDDDQRVADPNLRLTLAAERLAQLVAQRAPVVMRILGEQADLGRAGGNRVAVDRDAGAVGTALGHLGDHRAEVDAEVRAPSRGTC